jgi:hypothetical protein
MRLRARLSTASRLWTFAPRFYLVISGGLAPWRIVTLALTSQ